MPDFGSDDVARSATALIELDSVTQIKAKEVLTLKARVCEVVCNSGPLTNETVGEHMTSLECWYEDLPPNMTLSVLMNGPANPLTAAEQGALLLSHATYLGAIMMLHRRALVANSDRILEIFTSSDVSSTQMQDYVDRSVDAARVVVRIFVLLRFASVTSNMHIRCWVSVFEVFHRVHHPSLQHCNEGRTARCTASRHKFRPEPCRNLHGYA